MKEIPLTRGYVALVDDEDYDTLAQYKWCVATPGGNTYYACRYVWDGKRTTEHSMHRDILNPKANEQVDHRNHNGLDNQRHNLRIATGSQNCHNRRPGKVAKSGYRGVYPNGRKWQAQCYIGGKRTVLGNFPTPEQAAQAWNRAIIDAGLAEYATLNEVNEAR